MAKKRQDGRGVGLVALAGVVIGGVALLSYDASPPAEDDGRTEPPPAQSGPQPKVPTLDDWATHPEVIAGAVAPGRGPVNAYFDERGILRPPEECRFRDAEGLDGFIEIVKSAPDWDDRARARRAIRELEELPNNPQQFGEWWYFTIVAHLKAGSPEDEVQQSFRDAMQACPHFSELFRWRGERMVQAKKHRQAVGTLKRAIAVGEGYARPRMDLSRVYRVLGDLERARIALDELLEESPGHAAAYAARADILLEEKKPKLALQDADDAVRLDPNHGPGHWALARAKKALGEPAAAREAACAARARGVEPARSLCP